MRQRLAIFITIALVLLVLIALNAASYVPVERKEDSEWMPDRSTYNSGATGTRALYDFLFESGHQVMRWRESPSALLSSRKARPTTFVIIGKTIVSFDRAQAEQLLRWVEQGGRLVIIDRRADARLLPPSGDWRISTELVQQPQIDTPADNAEELTAGVKPARILQPTPFVRKVETVMPSRFAGIIKVLPEHVEAKNQIQGAPASTEEGDEAEAHEDESDEPAPIFGQPRKPVVVSAPPMQGGKPISPAPLVQLATERGAILVDYPYGAGRIVVLSDPFIVANNGISRADNLLLAVNVMTNAGGLIAFDEYHQGHAATQNELLAYFEGTPVVPMLAQAALILLVLLWTNGRRFARPLPLPTVDRRSKLEFVASMAELQQRARAYDLAIENIYGRTRRVLARYAGVDNKRSRADIAAGVAARSSLSQQKIEMVMAECEHVINGAPVDARKALQMVARLRWLERSLGLRMRSREVRQAKEMSG
ncbi:MAG TPA: DUF4350 domain-containing protein [Pyrinomonadaceae bacterium]|jgi:hypothetical protein